MPNACSAKELRTMLLRLRRKNPEAYELTLKLLLSLFGDKKSPK